MARSFLALALLLAATAGRADAAFSRSRALGLPWAGVLVAGVRLPPEGRHFFTWDPVLRRSPNRAWRRYGTVRLVRLVVRVANSYAAAHPRAPRIGIGDLSRPHGGDFGVRYGWPGHVSHQNGLDVDVYYPRRDRRERPPDSPPQIHRPLAQDLVDRFVRAGAIRVFVGPHTGLSGPRRVVQVLAMHDNHLHVRLAAPRDGTGRSTASGRRARSSSCRRAHCHRTTPARTRARSRRSPERLCRPQLRRHLTQRRVCESVAPSSPVGPRVRRTWRFRGHSHRHR